MVLFAVQNGGWCAAAVNLNGYKKYGKSGKCRNGKGGPWANDVYRITNPIRPALPKGKLTPDNTSPTRVLSFSMRKFVIFVYADAQGATTVQSFALSDP